MDIKDNLYSVLNQFGKENLQIEFQNDIASSISKIKEILDKTIETIYEKTSNEQNIDNCNKFQKPISSLCEAFLHFLLTSSSLPSQRRIKLKDLEIDLVIPDIKTFFQDPRKVIIIKFDKDSSTLEYINRLNVIQPYKDNIWVVSSTPITFYYRNYIIYRNKEEEPSHNLVDHQNERDEKYFYNSQFNNNNNNNNCEKEAIDSHFVPFNKILVDINKFLKDTKHKGFKFLPMS
jgi:hypothetical protein